MTRPCVFYCLLSLWLLAPAPAWGQEPLFPDWPIGTRVVMEGKQTTTSGAVGQTGRTALVDEMRHELLVVGREAGGRLRLLWSVSPIGAERPSTFRAFHVGTLLHETDKLSLLLSPDNVPILGLAEWDKAQKELPPWPGIPLTRLRTGGTWTESALFTHAIWSRRLERRVTVTSPGPDPGMRLIRLESQRKLPLKLTNLRGSSTETYQLTAYSAEWKVEASTGRIVSHVSSYTVVSSAGRTEETRVELTETARAVLHGDELSKRELALRELAKGIGNLRSFGGMSAADRRKVLADLLPHLETTALTRVRASLESDLQVFEKMEEDRDRAAGLVGKDAPDFTLENLEGKPVSLSSHRGKVVLLVFWGVG